MRPHPPIRTRPRVRAAAAFVSLLTLALALPQPALARPGTEGPGTTPAAPAASPAAGELLADGEQQLRQPVHPVTPVTPVVPEPAGPGTLETFPGHRGRPGHTVTPEPLPVPPGQVSLTHADTQALVAGASVACATNGGLVTSANGYLRHFTPADFGVVGELAVTAVSFGVEGMLGRDVTVTVNLYLLADPDGPFSYANFGPIGSAEATLAAARMSLVEVPVAGLVPAGATLVVEVAAPETRTGGLFLGSHPGAQSAGSYLRAEACGLPDPAPLDALGAPDMQLLLNVTGEAELATCDRAISGVHSGPVTVTEGVTCLAPGARVQGEVNVLDGAGLVATDATIQGPLASFGATVVAVTGGLVVGPVALRGSSDRLTLAGAEVVGSVLVVDNRTGDGPPEVAGNTIVGSLFCTGNEPPPVHRGEQNTVIGGMKLDQCAEL